MLSAAVSELFVINSVDNQVYEQRINANGTPTGAATLVAPGKVKNLATTKDQSNNDIVFVQGLDNQVYELKFNGSTPAGSYALTTAGSIKTMEIGAYGATTGSPELFVMGLDGQVYFQKFDASGKPLGNYALIPGVIKSFEVSATNLTPNTSGGIEVLFAIGLNDQVYVQKFDTSGLPTGSYSLTQRGTVKSIEAAPTGAAAANSFLLFAIGQDNQVYRQAFNSSGVSQGPYAMVRSGAVLSIEVANGQAARAPELFAVGLDKQVFAIPLDINGNATTAGYVLTARGQVKSIVAGVTSSTGTGGMFVAAFGLDDRVYLEMFNTSGISTTSFFKVVSSSVSAIGVPSTD